jgi:cytochrome c
MRFCLLMLSVVALAAAWPTAAAVSGHGGPIRALAVAADGGTALTGGFDYSVILWNLASGKPLRRMSGHNAAVDAVAFLPGGRAVSGSDDRSLMVWNLADGAAAARWTRHTAKIAVLAASPDGKTVASGGWDRRIVLWDVASGRSHVLGEHHANINALAFSPDGSVLASGDYDGRIFLWHSPTGNDAAALPGNGFPVNALAFAPAGELLAALGDGTVRIIDPATKRERLRYAADGDPVVSLAVSHDGSLAACGSSRGTIEVWRIATGETLRSIYAAPGPVWGLAFLPDGNRILSGGADGALRGWEVATGALVIGTHPAIAAAVTPADRGAMLFRTCAACHDFAPADHAKAGPTFWHLFGRRAGSVAGYPYSPALKASGLVWDVRTIDRLFAEGPEAVAPGSKMPLQKMLSAADRADLIEYLRRHASGAKPVE